MSASREDTPPTAGNPADEPVADPAGRRLERVLNQLDRFSSVLAHDLKAPLANVTSFAQLLPSITEMNDQGELMAERIAVNARRAVQMVDAVLDHVRRIGRPVDHAPVDLDEVMAAVVGALADDIAEAGAEVSHDDLPVVSGDAAALAVLLRHLVDNAIRYRDPARPVHVRVAATTSGDTATVTVVDDGPGVLAEKRELAFELGTRLVEVGGPILGSGVGLATARVIAENHGGDLVFVDPPSGEGTCVRLRLPVEAS